MAMRMACVAWMTTWVVVGAGCAIPECRGFANSCPDGEVCGADNQCIPYAPGTTKCEIGGDSSVIDNQGAAALATHWDCARPQPSDGAQFTASSGLAVMVSGGSTELRLTHDGGASAAGRLMYFGLRDERGFFARRLDSLGDDGKLPLELFTRAEVRSRNTTLWVAIDDGTGNQEEPHPGPFFEIPLQIIGVKSGDIQVSVSWDTFDDIDLYLTPPTAEDEIFYGHRDIDVGGTTVAGLDLDAFAGCPTGARTQTPNENIFWAKNKAPSGTYQVRLNYYANCTEGQTEHTVNYRVTIVVKEELLGVFEGQLLTPTPGAEGAGQEIKSFTIP